MKKLNNFELEQISGGMKTEYKLKIKEKYHDDFYVPLTPEGRLVYGIVMTAVGAVVFGISAIAHAVENA